MKPNLTFFCELEPEKLQALFANEDLIAKLKELNASISLGLLDFSPERAEVVKLLNKADIPVTAWMLLPKEQGYWFNLDNSAFAARRYGEWKQWSAKNKLKWAGIGLDIEPDINLMNRFAADPQSGIIELAKKLITPSSSEKAAADYRALITLLHVDGYSVESYQFCVMADERKAGSRLVQKVTGLIDLKVDREVFMLYSSLYPQYGAEILEAYAEDAQGIGLGSSGGGVVIEGQGEMKSISWEELHRDLLLAARYNPHIYIFSLEGCYQKGWLERMLRMDWSKPAAADPAITANIKTGRKVVQGFLWLTAHPIVVLAGLMGLCCLRHQTKKRRRCC